MHRYQAASFKLHGKIYLTCTKFTVLLGSGENNAHTTIPKPYPFFQTDNLPYAKLWARDYGDTVMISRHPLFQEAYALIMSKQNRII